MLRKQKGQGLTEFALILPLLLLLILGVIEASRVIWAFITVQQAAREAARFAVTGRPYLDSATSISGQLPVCLGNPTNDPLYVEPDPVQVTGAQPWLCEEGTNAVTGQIPYNPRVEAIKEVAFSQARALNISTECRDPAQYFGTDPTQCGLQPNAFGVLVRGQVTTETITGTLIVAPDPVDNHPGLQGLNIEVNTYFNLRMMTPVYDFIMAGNHITLVGNAQLQNEGLDSAAGIEPPPGIDPPPPPVADDTSGPGLTGQIWSTNGYNFQQSDFIRVHLEDHEQASGPFDVLLSDETMAYPICAGVPTDLINAADVNCNLSSVPPGTYSLYSTQTSVLTPRWAEAGVPVVITVGGDPKIEVQDGNIWAAGSVTQIRLLFHDTITTTAPYSLKLFDPDDNQVGGDFITGATGNSAELLPWTVQDVAAAGNTVCDLSSGKSCTIKSYDTNGVATGAETLVSINQPKIVLAAGAGPYAGGETVFIFLRGHTPASRYNVKVAGATDNDTFETPDTNAVGDTISPIAWIIPVDCNSSTSLGWPNGLYDITSHPLGQTPTIAADQFNIFTPSSPFITVEGGYTWFAGKNINIKLHKHDTDTTHYLEFNGVRIPYASSSDDTFLTDGCGDATVSFDIPPSTTNGDYEIASFRDSDDVEQASRDITVLDQPKIKVLEGPTVLPDQIINIEVTNHQPNFSYRIVYEDKQIGAVLTDPFGKALLVYNLGSGLPTLPTSPPPDFSSTTSYGIPWPLTTQTVLSPTEILAETFLTLQSADLVVTKVEMPATVPISTTMPITITIVNTKPVPINQWVDIDLYLDPDPVLPSHIIGYNFPGDVKFWKNGVAANETFIVTHTVAVSDFGLQSVYGYADTSGRIFEGEDFTVEVNNSNNINSGTYLVDCVGVEHADSFTTDYAQGAAIPDWSWSTYGNGSNQGYGTQIQGGSLMLNNSGSSNWQSDDNSGGQSFFYLDTQVASASGMNVAVKISDVSLIGSYSKAGLEIRNTLDSTSPRVVMGVARRDSASSYRRQFVQTGRRDGGGMAYVGTEAFWKDNQRVDLIDDGPIWLRIERKTDGSFHFYYNQTNASPPSFEADQATIDAWWGASLQSTTVGGIGDNVYIGLFNSPYQSNTAGTATFDDIKIFPDPAACANSDEVSEFPPGLEICNEVLTDRSFENPTTSTSWFHRPSQPAGVTLRTSDGGANDGVFKYRATTGNNFTVNPQFHFFQEFTMPDWVISSTTRFNLTVYERVRSYMTDLTDQQADKTYALVATTNDPATWVQLTDPVEVLNGESTAPYAVLEPDWTLKLLQMSVKAGVNLEDYANQQLFVYFYNDSNLSSTCPNTIGGCRTQFEFDDASLISCTTQPTPSPITTRIKGKLTLNFSDGSFEEKPFVRVWAYAADGSQVYETFTIQGGEFNFYNLPATAAGTEYFIFAQHYLQQGTQLETLAADTSVILIDGVHTDANPAQTFLDLYTLDPLP